MSLAEMLAGKSGRPGDNTEKAEVSNSKELAVESLRAAHTAMQQGDFAQAHDHMSDWAEHHKKSQYDMASPGQTDAEGDDSARKLIVIQHRG